MVLVCATAAGRAAARRAGITRYVPVLPTVEQVLVDVPAAMHHARRRARAELAAAGPQVEARGLIGDWLTGWDCGQFIAAATVVATVLVENVASHTDSAAVLRVETDDRTVTVAVEDASHVLPARRESDHGCRGVRGLDYLDVVCRRWGHSPTPTGKAVWALIGPENCL